MICFTLFYFSVSFFYGQADSKNLIDLMASDTFGFRTPDTLSDVIVSGYWKSVSRINSTLAVESYSSSFLQRNLQPDMISSLSRVNGLLPQTTCSVCNTSSIRLNGMDGPYTLVLIDGMPIVSALSSVYGLSGIPAALIKRVEVIKGPASTLFGSEAVAGVINMITKDPSSGTQVAMQQSVSSYGEWNADFSSDLVFAKARTLIGLNLFSMNRPWDLNQDGFTDIALQNRFSFFNKWNFQTQNLNKLNMAWRYFYEDRWGGQLGWMMKERGRDQVYAESIFTHRVEWLANAGFNLAGRELNFDGSYNYHQQDAAYGISSYDAAQHTAFAQMRTEWEWGKVSLLAGIPVRWVHYDDQTPATESFESGKNRPSVSWSTGLFSQVEWSMGKQWRLLAGARIETHNQHRPVLSPRIAIRFKAAENQVIRLSAGNGFRLVNLFTEEHAALTGARKIVVLEALKPERSWNLNIHHAASFNLNQAMVSLESNLFFTHFTNRILPDYESKPDEIIYKNLDGSAQSRGFSVQADYNKAKGIRWNFGCTWMDVFTQSETAIKKSMYYIPDFTATYGVGYTSYNKKWKADFTGTTSSPMRLPILPNDFRPSSSPWFSLLNIQASCVLSVSLELTIGIRNILNFLPKNPVLMSWDPFDRNAGNPVLNPNGYTFDASYSYTPFMKRRGFLAVSWKPFK